MKEPSVRIMDNASFQQTNRLATSASTKGKIEDWLQKTNISFSDRFESETFAKSSVESAR